MRESRRAAGIEDRHRPRSVPCAPGRKGRALERAASAAMAAGFLLLGSGCRDAVVEKPVPLFDRVPIQYPIALWDQDVEGRTVLRVRVDTAGRVDSAEVAESSGQAAFDSAALKGGRRLHFRPATRDGEPVTVWARVPVEFSKHPPPDSAAAFDDSTATTPDSASPPPP